MPLETLSAAKLHALIAKRDAAHTVLTREFIARGLGHYRSADIRAAALDDASPAHRLACDYVKADDALYAARSELEARRRYHGGDKPIRRAA
jgi:hypothetical protein